MIFLEKNEKDGIGSIVCGVCAFIFIIFGGMVGTFQTAGGLPPQTIIMGGFLVFFGIVFVGAGHFYFLRGVIAGKTWYGFVGLGVNMGAIVLLILFVNRII